PPLPPRRPSDLNFRIHRAGVAHALGARWDSCGDCGCRWMGRSLFGVSGSVRLRRVRVYPAMRVGVFNARRARSGKKFLRILPKAFRTTLGTKMVNLAFVDRKSTRLNSSHQIISYA